MSSPPTSPSVPPALPQARSSPDTPPWCLLVLSCLFLTSPPHKQLLCDFFYLCFYSWVSPTVSCSRAAEGPVSGSPGRAQPGPWHRLVVLSPRVPPLGPGLRFGAGRFPGWEPREGTSPACLSVPRRGRGSLAPWCGVSAQTWLGWRVTCSASTSQPSMMWEPTGEGDACPRNPGQIPPARLHRR